MASENIQNETGYVLVRHDVAEFLQRAATTAVNALEAGGILIGRYRGPHIEISGYTMPATEDVSSYSSFVKQDPFHQERALEAWRLSQGTDTDMGEWHTHPAGEPAPSGTDCRTWKQLVKRNKRRMIFVVAASSRWALYGVDSSVFGVRNRLLKPIENGDLGLIFA